MRVVGGGGACIWNSRPDDWPDEGGLSIIAAIWGLQGIRRTVLLIVSTERQGVDGGSAIQIAPWQP